MQKIDFKKELKNLYKPSAKNEMLVDVPQMNFIQIDGQGDPNHSQEFGEAVEALFSLSYALKFMIKKGEQKTDYGVMPLEGLWWTDNMAEFSVERKDEWKWTLMIMQPEFITEPLFMEALAQVKSKKKLKALSKAVFTPYSEGRCAQVMHIGPFSEEAVTIEKLHRFIMQEGYQLAGMHHEIYLSDIRRAAPEKWKTIIRQPVSRRP